MRTTLLHFFAPLSVLFNIPLLFDPRLAITSDVAPKGWTFTAYWGFPGPNVVVTGCGRRHNKDPAKVE